MRKKNLCLGICAIVIFIVSAIFFYVFKSNEFIFYIPDIKTYIKFVNKGDISKIYFSDSRDFMIDNITYHNYIDGEKFKLLYIKPNRIYIIGHEELIIRIWEQKYVINTIVLKSKKTGNLYDAEGNLIEKGVPYEFGWSDTIPFTKNHVEIRINDNSSMIWVKNKDGKELETIICK